MQYQQGNSAGVAFSQNNELIRELPGGLNIVLFSTS